jgi:hypothetical protein
MDGSVSRQTYTGAPASLATEAAPSSFKRPLTSRFREIGT